MKINKIRVGVNGYGVIGKRVADAGLPVTGVLIRRATDPWESDHGGIRNTIVPEAHIPSHQGPDD